MPAYLVGPTGGVESVRSAHKQGVFILLQEDFDEVVTLILFLKEKKKMSAVTFVSFNFLHMRFKKKKGFLRLF